MTVARSLTSTPEAFVFMLDADDCVYNEIYRYLLFILIQNHRPFIDEYKQFMAANRENLSAPEVQRQRDKYRQHFNSILNKALQEIKNLSEVELYNKVGELINEIKSEKSVNYRAALVEFIDELNGIDKELYKTVLIRSNEVLLACLEKEVRTGQYKHVGMLCGSGRQCEIMNEKNRKLNGTGCFFTDSETLRQALNHRLVDLREEVCHAHPLRSQHLGWRKKPDGREECYLDFTSKEKSIGDSSKFSNLYLDSHWLDLDCPETKDLTAIKVVIIDDLDSIFRDFAVALPRNNMMFPTKIQYSAWQYFGLEVKEMLTMTGAAFKPHNDYLATTVAMWRHCERKAREEQKPIDVIRHLELTEKALCQRHGFRQYNPLVAPPSPVSVVTVPAALYAQPKSDESVIEVEAVLGNRSMPETPLPIGSVCTLQ